MVSSVHPIFVLAALGIVASIILLLTVFRVRSLRLKLLLLFVAVLTLAPTGIVVVLMYPEWVDARFRSYKAFYADIQLGMTREEVMNVQDKLYPEGGPRMKPRIIVDESDHLTFFMHPEAPDSTVNCEAIILKLRDGKVISKTYSPD